MKNNNLPVFRNEKVTDLYNSLQMMFPEKDYAELMMLIYETGMDSDTVSGLKAAAFVDNYVQYDSKGVVIKKEMSEFLSERINDLIKRTEKRPEDHVFTDIKGFEKALVMASGKKDVIDIQRIRKTHALEEAFLGNIEEARRITGLKSNEVLLAGLGIPLDEDMSEKDFLSTSEGILGLARRLDYESILEKELKKIEKTMIRQCKNPLTRTEGNIYELISFTQRLKALYKEYGFEELRYIYLDDETYEVSLSISHEDTNTYIIYFTSYAEGLQGEKELCRVVIDDNDTDAKVSLYGVLPEELKNDVLDLVDIFIDKWIQDGRKKAEKVKVHPDYTA